MRLMLRQGGTRETFSRDVLVCRDGLGGIWRNGERHAARALALRIEGVCRVHRDWPGARLDPLFHSVVMHAAVIAPRL
jgi:hypothetical protein